MSTKNSGSEARKPSSALGASARRPAPSRGRDSVTATKSSASSAGGAKRPAGSANRPLVRPAPRSKVRRAHLTVAKIDLWSIAKLVFLLSVAVGIVTVVATVILWLVFEVTGIFDGINSILSMLSSQGNAVQITDYLSLGQVAVYATILSVLNVVLLTLLGIIAGFLYNIAAKLVGGIGVTLTDD
ncbi:DUF3566 domain-containing protein [Amycolatopsis sp. H6(2020)]|uniref:DUF3566 domain-containing protein n=1 Tax=Rothia kristinae TaxID=37923 RepID=A0A7T4MS69_9MICC|nr:DUF3566 domain-containing protein [Rothia kristinae]MBE8528317.1 DUF3566 domain-containing protein [Amycolatopsis sp. H6(2020)]MDN5639438.1 DUF3566 domain-containing protein [Actinomycetes bacterium]QQC58648.1 DUF3566 domain-containing protein [Rothia kristinae]